MPKATVQKLRDEGWRVEQFGGALDATQFDAYLGDVLAEAGRWAEHHLGVANYAAVGAGNYVHDILVRAELAFCAARFWKRRASFFDSQAHAELQTSEALERREYLAHAKTMIGCAEAALAEAMQTLGLDPGNLGADWAGMASGIVETGRFPPSMMAVPA